MTTWAWLMHARTQVEDPTRKKNTSVISLKETLYLYGRNPGVIG